MMIVRLGEPSTPLYLVLQNVQATLIVGMALALLLSLVGAWIAARSSGCIVFCCGSFGDLGCG